MEDQNQAAQDASARSIIRRIADGVSAFKDPLVDVAEAAADSTLNDGLLRDLPLVGWATKAYDIRDKLQQARLKRNAETLISALQPYDVEKIRAIHQKFAKDPQREAEFIDVVMSTVLESRKREKVILAARLLGALSTGSLSPDRFLTLIDMVHSSVWETLQCIERYGKKYPAQMNPNHDPSLEPQLTAGGFYVRPPGNDFGYLTQPGKDLWSHGFSETSPS